MFARANRYLQVGQCRAYPSCGFRWAHYGLLRPLRSFLAVRFFCRSKLEGPVRPYGVASQLRPTAGDTEKQTRYPFSVFAVCFVGLPAVPQDFRTSEPTAKLLIAHFCPRAKLTSPYQ